MTGRKRCRVATAGLVLLCAVGPVAAAELPYSETFAGSNGAPWPAPWFAGGSHVTVWDLQAGRGRLNGDPAFVARMILPGFAENDVEALVTFEFEDVQNQGIGFYVRQNGGTLQEYQPHGQGYAMFLKGGWAWHEDLGLWREIDGVETQFAWGPNPIPGGLQNGTRYRLRYRVTQTNPTTTHLQAKVWPEASGEPVAWTIEADDTRPELQGTPGSFAADIYNFSGFNHVFLDDLTIQRYPIPLDAPEAPAASGRWLSLPRPHPVVGRARVDIDLPVRSSVNLEIYDVTGRRVASPFAGALSAGPSTIDWQPRGKDGRRLPPGVYFLRLESDVRRATQRFVVSK